MQTSSYTQQAIASQTSDKPWLRRLMLLDGIGAGVPGALMLIFTQPAMNLFGMEQRSPVQITGLILLLVGAFIFFSLQQKPLRRLNLFLLVDINVSWVVASMVVLLTDPWNFSTLGSAIVLVQAIGVGVLVLLEWLAWQRG